MRQIYNDDSKLAHSIHDVIPAVIIIADSDLSRLCKFALL